MPICYCGSERTFEECCGKFINGISKPSTAEELMRSRYSAYVTASVPYILQTTHSSTRNLYDPNAIKEWAISSMWLKLEILQTKKGNLEDGEGFVEFKATYKDADNNTIVHHEYSHFLKEKGEWFFVEGKMV
jgi:SEC-C motif domain protein